MRFEWLKRAALFAYGVLGHVALMAFTLMALFGLSYIAEPTFNQPVAVAVLLGSIVIAVAILLAARLIVKNPDPFILVVNRIDTLRWPTGTKRLRICDNPTLREAVLEMANEQEQSDKGDKR